MLPLLRLLSLVLVVLVPFGVVACGGDDDGEAGGDATATEEGGEEAAPSFELKIGPVLPLTGDLAGERGVRAPQVPISSGTSRRSGL